MKLITRTVDVITNNNNLEDLHSTPNVPILMSCTTEEESTDIKKDLVWQISKDSGIVQLKNLIPLDVLYSIPHSGTTGKMWIQHHQEFSKFLNKFNPRSVLEIGGAHGILATEYLKNNVIPWTIIEPNPCPVDKCPAKFIKGFFDDKFSTTEKIDTIVHSHVFEHVYDPNEFMQNIANMLHNSDKLIFTLPNMQIMLENKYTNCINFEHTVFLTEDYVKYLLSKFGFRIVEKSYFKNHSIFFSTVRDDTVVPFDLDPRLYEKNKQLYLNYVKYYENLIVELNNKLKYTTLPVYLFGAHVFSQYLITAGLDITKINSILDNDSSKQDKRLYGTKFKIQSPQVLGNKGPMIVILKAGFYNEEIKKDILENINSDIIFWE
jgi:SAM-dependent methyltransferase